MPTGFTEVKQEERIRRFRLGEMWCPRCHCFKLVSEFGKDKHTLYGIVTTCRACKNIRRQETRDKVLDAEYALRIKFVPKSIPNQKLCTGCGDIKFKSEFYKRSTTPSGLSSQCRECRTLAKRKYYAENVSKITVYNKEYAKKFPEKAIQKSNRRRANKALVGGLYTIDQIGKLFSYYSPNGACLRRGSVCDKLDIDHVVPIKLGGGNSPRNLQPLCPRCNKIKGARVADYRFDKGEFAGQLEETK